MDNNGEENNGARGLGSAPGAGYLRSPLVHLLLISAVVLAVYSNTFSVPFQWDGRGYIYENTLLRDFRYFLDPELGQGVKYHDYVRARPVGYFTFALNYALDGFDVTGYHVVNTAVHAMNAFLVYLIAFLTFRTPLLAGSFSEERLRQAALLGALLFTVHPLQTEAVTYIFQRLASLVTFFYLLSLAAYAGSRLTEKAWARYGLYALSLLGAVLAMKTKENAFTLPAVIVLYELIFFSGPKGKRALRLVPLLLTMAIVPMTRIGVAGVAEVAAGNLYEATANNFAGTRWEYLFTQFRVLVTYLRLLLFPVNQNIGYDYPVYETFFAPQVFMSFIFLAAIFALGVFMLYRSLRGGVPVLGLYGFAILWFFITISIESSIFPISMVIDEYRVYLPGVFIFIAAGAGGAAAVSFAGTLKSSFARKAALSACVCIVLVLGGAAYARNSVWGTRISLWEDTVGKSPGYFKARINLGNSYKEAGRLDNAIREYRTALELAPGVLETYNNLGVTYRAKGMVDEAIKFYLKALKLDPSFEKIHMNLGVAYFSKGMVQEAIAHYRLALDLMPERAETHNNLGVAYFSKGMVQEAITHYRQALALRPGYKEAKENLSRAQTGPADGAGVLFNEGVGYADRGMLKEAERKFRAALREDPSMAEAHFNLGSVLRAEGMVQEAVEHLKAAIGLRGELAEARFTLGSIYVQKGMLDEAEHEFAEGLAHKPGDLQARAILDKIRELKNRQ